ncbi:hypothetical protein MFLO_00730 [Listeria floridensis FSL S10-1187]|uniref:Lipoprotein n=1 Tax=Listeria floridensis FSL S10-1187 TaxID=1265817 RepID=A0ABN0RIC4_9LIST|nr:hypothetical protein [Listeria floridensis]EUJ33724.1 hypothetical protein MFLO_00730 [Listeria floridensis FSL S10-1187]
MNFWPFQGNKEAGIPDNQVKMIEEKQSDALGLLFSSYGTIGFNVKAKSVSLVLDVYQKTTVKKHVNIAEIGQSKKSMYSGQVVWGLTGTDPMQPDEVRAFIRTAHGAYSTMTKEFPQGILDNKDGLGSSTDLFKNGKVTLNEKKCCAILEY